MVDHVQLTLSAGNGGRGAVSFLRMKYKPIGPADGGDGGDGGSVLLQGNANLATLYDLAHEKRIRAEHGEAGMKRNKHGKNAPDLVIQVPLGTEVYEETAASPVVLGEILADDEVLLVARGGKGGRGNARFKSSTNRSPQQAQPGERGEEKVISLDLKLIAQVGLIGFPNAGKSSLLNVLSRAHARVAPHQFTTLEANLGVMVVQGTSLVLADIPGLIEGASRGKGLGLTFLRHIERTRVLVHMLDPFSVILNVDQPPKTEKLCIEEGVFARYAALRAELAAYNPAILAKEEIIVVNKIDLAEVKNALPGIREVFNREMGSAVLGISTITGEGIKELGDEIIKRVQAPLRQPTDSLSLQHQTRLTLKDLKNKRMVFNNPHLSS